MPQRETSLPMRKAREILAPLLGLDAGQIDAWVIVALDTVNENVHFHNSPTVKLTEVPGFLIWAAREFQNESAEAN